MQIRTPSPAQIKRSRELAKLSKTEAAEIIHSKERTWQGWEYGRIKMHKGMWELFLRKTGQYHE